MSCSRTSRPAAAGRGRLILTPPLSLLVAAALSTAMLGTLSGCRDDLPEPTAAEVQIRFLSSEAGLADGAQVYLDGNLIRSSLSGNVIDTLLSAGNHTIVFYKTCVSAEPSDTLAIQVVAGDTQQVDFRLASASNVLVVDSDLAGLPIRLNGTPTGRTTPSSFVCLDPGRYEVSVPGDAVVRPGFDLIAGDTLQAVDVPEQGSVEANFAFTYTPRPQARGVLLEVFTATLCPNCPKADEAAESIEQDPAYADEAMVSMQLHLSWMGSDPFYNDDIGQRVIFYGNDQSAPYAYFNGMDKLEGSSNPDLEGAYRARVDQTYGEDAEAGLYWSNVRLEGDQIGGGLRFVAIEDLSRFQQLKLTTFVAKDSLIAMNPYQVPQFDGVIRDISAPIALDDYRVGGSYLDAIVQFDLQEDNEDWPTPTLRLVAIVQDAVTREIIQCREVRTPVP